MPIFHVETKDDFLFFTGLDRDAVIKYCRSKNLKLNAVNEISQYWYDALIDAGFIKKAKNIYE